MLFKATIAVYVLNYEFE